MPGKTIRSYRTRRTPRRGALGRKKRGIYSTKPKLRSANTVRKIARKAAKNVLKEKRPILHRRFNLDANDNGFVDIVHNQWDGFFVEPHSTGNPYSGGLAELANQAATSWPMAAQEDQSSVTRLIPVAYEPGAVPGRFRTHRYINDAYIKGQITFSQFADRCGGYVRIIGVKYRQGQTITRDDIIMQTNSVAPDVYPPQNLYDAPQRPPLLRKKHMHILFDKRMSLKSTGGELYGGPDIQSPITSMINGERYFKFTMKLGKKFDYGQVNGIDFDPDTADPSKWNYGFFVCGYGGNGVALGNNICKMTFKGDLCFRNPL